MMKKILEGKKIKNKFSFVWADSKMLTKPLHVSVPYHFVFLGEVLNYIEKMINNEIDVFDFESGDTEFYKFINSISTNNYSAIAFFVSPDNIENTLTLLKYIKTISPETKCIAYGELCVFLQDYFKSTTFDAIVSDRCDSEVAIFDFFMYAEKKKNKNELRGVKFIENGELKLSTKGEFIPGKEWGFTDVNKPFVKELFGIEGKKQVTIEIARGCPYDCMYCKEVSFSGTIERRRPIEKIIKYINSINCDRFKFYASNFTLDEEYAIELCEKLIKNPKKIKWSCTTRPDLLKNEVLIEKMAEAGCEKISVGIETAEIDELISLNRNYNTNVIIQGIKMLNKYNITYKALIMIGVPGQTKESILKTLNLLSNYNIIVRPTAYTPFYEMKATMDAEEISRFDKRTYYNSKVGISYANFLRLIYDVNEYKDILEKEINEKI